MNAYTGSVGFSAQDRLKLRLVRQNKFRANTCIKKCEIEISESQLVLSKILPKLI